MEGGVLLEQLQATLNHKGGGSMEQIVGQPSRSMRGAACTGPRIPEEHSFDGA